MRAAFARCAPLTAADHRPIPFIRYWLGGAPGSVRTVEGGASRWGRCCSCRAATAPPTASTAKTFPHVRPPAGYAQIYRNASWRVFAAPGCASAAAALRAGSASVVSSWSLATFSHGASTLA